VNVEQPVAKIAQGANGKFHTSPFRSGDCIILYVVTTFSFLTLNCFGAPAPLTRRRLLTLAHQLNQRDFSFVCLQEVQAHAYRQLLIQSCAQYPFNTYAPFLHAPKGGLLTLARLPIEQHSFTLYNAREIPYLPAVMDWVLHKGVLHARTTLDGVPIVVLNTHLNANYSGDWRPASRYARAEHNQLRQLAELVLAQPPEALVVVAGDFNIPRGSWLYDEFLAASGMIDPLAGDTRPTYRTPPGVPARYALPIDFALVRHPRLPGLLIRSDICFTETLPFVGGRQGYLSDHYGVELRVSWGAQSG
jgi:endonuclease/exonuclease/phosphatase family metal-dependent hydrolase